MKKNHPNENTDESKLDHWYGGPISTPKAIVLTIVFITIATIIGVLSFLLGGE